MKIVGLITEYNPFHKGHAYHIQRAKELTGADACVVVMSGNYVQRGTPAFMDKYTRTAIALNHGADVIFELPLPFACSSAEYFATAAVTLLHKMGCIDYICFGSECDDISVLSSIAKTLLEAKIDNGHKLNELIKEHVKTGLPYASARSKALAVLLGDSCVQVTDKPNNILAIEYLKALMSLNSSIKPVAITRTNATYHHNEANDALYSASSLRSAITDFNTDNQFILEELFSFDNTYAKTLNHTAPITEDDFSSLLGGKLLSLALQDDGIEKLTTYAGIDTDLANRMSSKDILYSYNSFSNLTSKLKTKNIAYTSISRALLALTLDITKNDIDAYLSNGVSSYVKLLGFKKNASFVLNEIKKKGILTIIGQLSEANDNLSLTDIDRRMLSHSLYCDELYNMIIRQKYKADIPSEYTRKLTIV